MRERRDSSNLEPTRRAVFDLVLKRFFAGVQVEPCELGKVWKKDVGGLKRFLVSL